MTGCHPAEARRAAQDARHRVRERQAGMLPSNRAVRSPSTVTPSRSFSNCRICLLLQAALAAQKAELEGKFAAEIAALKAPSRPPLSFWLSFPTSRHPFFSIASFPAHISPTAQSQLEKMKAELEAKFASEMAAMKARPPTPLLSPQSIPSFPLCDRRIGPMSVPHPPTLLSVSSGRPPAALPPPRTCLRVSDTQCPCDRCRPSTRPRSAR